MKRLLCILSGMNSGGAEGFLMKLYRHLDRTRYQMDFCINNPERQFYENEIESLGGKVYRIPFKSADLSGFKQALSAVVRDNSYRHVLRVTSNAMGFLDLKIARDAGAEICAARSSNASDGGGWKPWLAHCLGRFLYDKYVNVKIAPSDLAAKYTFGKGAYERGEVKMIRNAVDLEVFKFDDANRYKVRAELGIPRTARVLGHIGRFQHQKNHDYLLRVFAAFLRREKDAWLLLVGDGELKLQICALSQKLGVADRVVFAGIRRDIPQLLSAMDTFVFPSFFEGMPNTVIEAQATGLPCVIADTITREADITGSVKYLPINLGAASLWVDAVARALSVPRKDAKDDFVRAGYEIGAVAKNFQEIIFSDKK